MLLHQAYTDLVVQSIGSVQSIKLTNRAFYPKYHQICTLKN